MLQVMHGAVIGVALVLVLGIAVAGYLLTRGGTRRPTSGAPVQPCPVPIGPPAAPPEPDEYRVLLTMVLGDRDKVERLIGYEMRSAAGLGRPAAIAQAIKRLREDLAGPR